MSALTAEELAKLRIDPIVAALTWHMGLEGLRVWDERDGLEGTIVRGEAGGLLVWCPTEGDGHSHALGQEWALDLADSSTADRLARWVAGRVGLEVGCTAPEWMIVKGPPPHGWWHLGPHRFGAPDVYLPPRHGAWTHRVHVLANLDPTDNRRLPDGSRFIDRLALALVAVHVGAQS